ncbi:MAG: sterol desaturase family protein [Gemmatimonadota bacterium]|nr:sterol desaturase family protein [Gemmatimonadota bacterium]MDQ8147449.1 sterol desaturase family protein [Gemmatimonadota bacterium]MDQ8149340.1 sterol desaturase family protein [Gemmatimonadota bacterium]MDQ8155987.1 sterol desaturase family protein [Gemmatimonadota bacterium]MDQ8176886.1 sterol desaturase family protein [Gemmatimonadota bacterium]
MDALIAYFAGIPSSHRALILAGGIALFWLWETAEPLLRSDYRKGRHALVNLFFTGTTIIVNFLLAFLLLRASEWAVAREVGVLFLWPGLPIVVQLLVGLLILDLVSAWVAHWVQHKTPMLWRLHLVHHSDRHVDTTTANRHHPGESVVRFGFTLAAVVLTGAPMWMVFLYQSLSVVLSQFNHANIALPAALDRAISWVLVSPDMHKVHHHYVLPHTDSNYGNLFSVWDRLFGTFRTIDRAQLTYGIDTHLADAEHASVGALLTMPLRKGTRRLVD